MIGKFQIEQEAMFCPHSLMPQTSKLHSHHPQEYYWQEKTPAYRQSEYCLLKPAFNFKWSGNTETATTMHSHAVSTRVPDTRTLARSRGVFTSSTCVLGSTYAGVSCLFLPLRFPFFAWSPARGDSEVSARACKHKERLRTSSNGMSLNSCIHLENWNWLYGETTYRNRTTHRH